MTEYTVFRFEFLKDCNGSNPFDELAKAIGFKDPEKLDTIELVIDTGETLIATNEIIMTEGE